MQPMTESQKDMSIGMDIGVFAFCQLMARQKTPWEPAQFERFAQQVADNIERETGMPAEDVALNLIPVMEQAIKSIGGLI